MTKHNDSMPRPCGRPKVRDRIFETASELFYRQGIRCVGVDAIATEAGTNKMSFYRSFSSKDELVAEYLREQEREHWEWWDSVVAPHAGDPRRQIEALFESYANKLRVKDTCGCALVNAAVEIREVDHPALAVVHGYKVEMRRRFRALAQDLGVAAPDALGDALTLLVEGSAMTKLTFPCGEGPFVHVAQAARALLDAHLARA